MQYVFGAFVLDTDQYELRCHGELVALEPKAYQVLTYLVQHRDRLVTQDELLAQAWPDVAVDRLAVARCISLIRRTVGDSADMQHVIQTRRGHGYRFVTEVTEQETISSAITPSEVPTMPDASSRDASAAWPAERSCPSCQHANPHTARFCMACGEPLIAICASCTQTVARPAAFCPACGQPLAPRPTPEASPSTPEGARPTTPTPHAEHKVVSICYSHFSLASDSPAALDREALHDRQQAMAQMVAEVVQPYGGELYELDSHHLVVVFGVPEAMEDHAQRAVFAALAILQHASDHAFDATPHQVVSSSTRLAWHLGIHSGLVVAGQNPSELQRAITVSGVVLQGAAVLAHQAGPGTLLLSEATSRWVHDDIQLKPVAPVSISGWSEPLLAFRVSVPPSVPLLWTTRAMRRHTRFIGRGAELERLHHHLDLVFQGQGQIVSLVGEPGIGKTRLVTEFIHAERGRSTTCLISSCHAYGQHTPYLPLVALLRQLFARYDRNTPGRLRDDIQDTLRSLDMATEENLSILLHLLDNPVTVTPPDECDPQQRRQQTFAVLHQLLIRLSQHQPLLMAIDDLHWIDATSLAFLGEFSEHIGGAHVFLLVSARPGYQPFWPTVSYVTQLSLAGLTEDEGQDVVQSVGAAAPINVSTRRQIIAKAQGNPLFLEELPQSVIEHGHDVTLAVPDTVQAVLSARIDRLPSDTKRLLMIAAVIGPEKVSKKPHAWQSVVPSGESWRCKSSTRCFA